VIVVKYILLLVFFITLADWETMTPGHYQVLVPLGRKTSRAMTISVRATNQKDNLDDNQELNGTIKGFIRRKQQRTFFDGPHSRPQSFSWISSRS
jgi:hypothetical protein